MNAPVRRVLRALPAVLAAVVPAASGAAQEADTVRVVMETELGDIVVDVYPGRAPVTAANFLRYVDGGHFEGATFYRTVTYENDNGSPPIEVIQGGPGNAGSPFPPIRHETTEATGLRHLDGTISMARNDVGTATSEFFICVGDQPALDFGATRNPDGQGFAAFGRVVEGMDVVRRIHALPSGAPTGDDYVRGQLIEDPPVVRAAYRR